MRIRCSYAMQRVASQGFVPMMTPDLVRESVLRKCGFQPRAENTQVQSIILIPLSPPPHIFPTHTTAWTSSK